MYDLPGNAFDLLEIVLSNAIMASVLAAAAWLVGRALRRPAVAHALWLLVLLKLITPPLYPVAVPWPQVRGPAVVQAAGDAQPTAEVESAEAIPEPVLAGELASEPSILEPVVAASIVESPPSEPPTELVAPATLPPYAEANWLALWPIAVVVVAIGGSAGWCALLVVRVARFRRLLRFAMSADAELQEHAAGLAQRLGLKALPSIWMVPGAVSPMLWGLLGKPRLLIPIELWKRLDWSQRGALLTHELAHYRRGDHWVRGLELVVTCLYWWHPVVWWARHELREAEEQCCDAWVLWTLPAARQSYARVLVATMDFMSEAAAPLPAPASGFGQVHQLKRRLTMILRGNTPRALGWMSGLAVLGLAALLLPMWPTWAQPPRDNPPPGDRRPSGPPPREGDRDPDRERERGREGDRERNEDLDRARAEIDRLRDQLRRAEERLEGLMRQRAEVERRRDEPRPEGQRPGQDRRPEGGGAGFGRPGAMGFGGPGMPGPGFAGIQGGFAEMDRRLSEVERKLERLMEMMERVRPGPGGPSVPAVAPPPPARRESDVRRAPVPPEP